MVNVIKTIQEDNTNNARVKISYLNANPEVKFEYIQLDSQWKNTLSMVFKIWFARGFYGIVCIPFLLIVLSSRNEILYSLAIISIMFWIFIFPLILTLIFVKNEKLRLSIPILQYKFSYHYEMIINKDNLKEIDFYNNIIELPLFKNVGLEYEATEDFSEYLKEVEIVEHPWNFVCGKIKKRNYFLWKTRFKYTKVPINGELRLRFS